MILGGAKEPGVIYFPTNWGAKEPQNLPNHRVAEQMAVKIRAAVEWQFFFWGGKGSLMNCQKSWLLC